MRGFHKKERMVRDFLPTRNIPFYCMKWRSFLLQGQEQRKYISLTMIATVIRFEID